MYVCVVLLSNRNEDRKIALLNLLSVGGLLGIFSMWRKIRKSRWNLCQAVEVTASSHTLPGLVGSYQTCRGDSSHPSASEKEATRAREKKTNTGMRKAPVKCQLFFLTMEKA